MKNEQGLVLSQIKQRIASGEDIYETVYSYFAFCQRHLPVERMSMGMLDFEQKNLRIIAQASVTGSEKTDFIMAMPEDLPAAYNLGYLPQVYMVNEPAADPIGQNIIRRSGFKEWSLIGMPIKEEKGALGAIFFTTSGKNRYTEKHAALLSDLYDAHKWLLDAVITEHEHKPRGPGQKEFMDDKYEFFRQVTRRLCGHLDMETGVLHCFQYLSRFFHASMLSVHKHHKSGDTDIIGVGPTCFFNYFDPDMMARDTENLSPREKTVVPKTVIVNQPERDPTLNRTVKTFGADWSSITMYLSHKRVPLGLASLVTEGRNVFTEAQRELFAMLHDPFSLALSNHIKHREVLRLKNIIEDEKKNLQEELHVSREATIVGGTSGLKGVMGSARVVAGRNSPVLITGETGVGKEIIADFIHQQSSRKNSPLIKVNCGAIPDTLIDSELFGHEKGAFTGADTLKKGRFERADGGTIFLDEVAELPLPAQIRMLRVLQNKIIERVGGTEPIPVDIRVIAATHRNLEEMVASGKFREDLWFRLNVFPIHIPPLRSRRSDIPALVDHFIGIKSREMNLRVEPFLSPDAMGRLITYEWPGNVRELANVIERELILKKGEALTFENMVPTGLEKRPRDNVMTKDDLLPLDEVYRRHIKKVLEITSGKISGPAGAAEKLKIKPGTLRKRMDKLGIQYGWKKQ
ncbi:MAG: sigma-54-dependent Fis family transcriptional regulator [Thermodesulfobacteriota bacterium]